MKKEHGDGLFRLLAPSVAGLLACVVCLCATTWAWFSAAVTAAATTIRSASYTVNITIEPVAEQTADANGVTTYALAADQQNDAESYAVSETDGVHSVKFLTDGEYIITLTPASENTATNGYCLVEYNGTAYYTDQLTTGSLSFTVTAAAETTLTITPTWGTRSQEALPSGVPLFSNGSPFTQVDEATQQAKQSPAVDIWEEPDEQPTEDKTQEETDGKTDEAGQSGEDEDSSGDSESPTPAESETGTETGAGTGTGTGTGTETGDSGNPDPASDEAASDTPDVPTTPDPSASAVTESEN